MKCAHCREARGVNRWQPQLCADGRKKRSKWLCDPCDVKLNRMVLEFFGDASADAKIAAYTKPAKQEES